MRMKRTEVFTAIEKANTPEEIFSWIKRAEEAGPEPEFNKDVLFRVKSYAIERLADLTADNDTAARKLILGPVLDICVEGDPTGEGRHHTSEYRNLLLKWIEQFPFQVMRSLRGELLEEIARRLKVMPHSDLVWMVAVLGYRDNGTCAVLKDLALHDTGDHSIRDAALATLCTLGGLSASEKESFRELAEKRLEEESSIPLSNTLRWLCSPKSVDFLLKEINRSEENERSFFPNLFLATLSEIAESDSHEVAERIWKGIVASIDENAAEENSLRINNLVFNSGVLKRIDLEAIPGKLLGLLTGDGGGRRDNHFHYIIYNRLSELTGINQLQGFAEPIEKTVVQAIKNDCTRNTGNTTRQMTLDHSLKESAWDTALRLGIPCVMDWTEGVFGEDSPYARGHILKLLACLGLDKLPDQIGDWLCERVCWEGGNTPEIFYIEPAIRLAGSSSVPRVLEWLLNLGITYRGQVPMSATEALSAYCIERIEAADDQCTEIRAIVSALLSAFDPNWNSKNDRARQRRMLAAAALETVSAEFGLTDQETKEVVRLFAEMDLSDDLFALCPLALIVAASSPDENALNRLNALALDQNGWVAAYGVSSLEKMGAVDSATEVLKKNGLVKIRDTLDVIETATVTELGGYILGRQYMKNRDCATSAVAAVIESGEWRAVSQLLRVLTSAEHSAQPVGNRVSTALLTRIHEKMSAFYSETNLFQYLARLAPDQLLETEWDKYWANWPTESRISLINATSQAVKDCPQAHSPQAISILGGLERDPVLEVRQEARRVWSVLWPESLDAHVEGRATSQHSSENDLRFAGEALWAVTDEGVFNQVKSVLINNPERRVREACCQSIKERRERRIAQSHLDAVLASKADTASILATWKYGSALIEIGSTEHLEALRHHLVKSNLRANQRYWLKILVEKLEKKVKERKRKEAPDWSPPGAQTLRQSGKIKTEGQEREAFFVIRKWESEELGKALNWEGDGWISDGMATHTFENNVEIVLENGAGGTAIVTWSNLDISSGTYVVPFSFSGMKWKVGTKSALSRHQ